MLTPDELNTLSTILKELSSNSEIISRSAIFSEFKSRTNYQLEEYKFKLELCDVIRYGQIEGYEIRVGRKGGVAKKDPVEAIIINTSFGNYTGQIKKTKLLSFISELKND